MYNNEEKENNNTNGVKAENNIAETLAGVISPIFGLDPEEVKNNIYVLNGKNLFYPDFYKMQENTHNQKPNMPADKKNIEDIINTKDTNKENLPIKEQAKGQIKTQTKTETDKLLEEFYKKKNANKLTLNMLDKQNLQVLYKNRDAKILENIEAKICSLFNISKETLHYICDILGVNYKSIKLIVPINTLDFKEFIDDTNIYEYYTKMYILINQIQNPIMRNSEKLAYIQKIYTLVSLNKSSVLGTKQRFIIPFVLNNKLYISIYDGTLEYYKNIMRFVKEKIQDNSLVLQYE